jgi:hypothetical protein
LLQAAFALSVLFQTFLWIAGNQSGFLSPVFGAPRLPTPLMSVFRAAMFPGYDLLNDAPVPGWLFLPLFELVNVAFWCLAFFAMLKTLDSLVRLWSKARVDAAA